MHLSTSTFTRLAAALATAALAAGCAGGPGERANPQSGASDTAQTPGAGTGRAGTADRSPGRQAPGSSPHGGSSAAVTIRVTITNGQVDPPPHRVEVDQGQTVRLKISSDSTNKIHVHGYDLEQQVAPSEPAVITFTADQVGVFEVETHHPALQVLQLQVR